MSTRPFDFLKGNDPSFQNAMKSVDSLYDDMFGDDSKYDSMFETFKTENNPITASIDQMSREIFGLDEKNKEEEKYVKLESQGKENTILIGRNIDEDEESVVLGEPVYVGFKGQQQQQPGYYAPTQYQNPYYQK